MKYPDPIWDKLWAALSTATFTLVRDINITSQRLLAEALMQFQNTPGMTMGDLRAMLANVFGEARANTIAVTELTRAHYEGAKLAADEISAAGIPMVGIWQTNNDDLVCEICAPLNNLRETPEGGWDPSGHGPGVVPPAHPNCRCDIGYDVDL